MKTDNHQDVETTLVFKNAKDAEKLLSLYLLDGFKKDKFIFSKAEFNQNLIKFNLGYTDFFMPSDGEFHVSFSSFHEILFQAIAIVLNLNNCSFEKARISGVDCKLLKKIVKTSDLSLNLKIELLSVHDDFYLYRISFDMEEGAFKGNISLITPSSIDLGHQREIFDCESFIPKYLKTLTQEINYQFNNVHIFESDAKFEVIKEFVSLGDMKGILQDQLLALIVLGQLTIVFGSFVCGFNEKPGEFYLTRIRWSFDFNKYAGYTSQDSFFMSLEKKIERQGRHYIAVNCSNQKEFSATGNIIF